MSDIEQTLATYDAVADSGVMLFVIGHAEWKDVRAEIDRLRNELVAFAADVEGAEQKDLSFAMACVRSEEGITVRGALECQRNMIAELRAALDLQTQVAADANAQLNAMRVDRDALAARLTEAVATKCDAWWGRDVATGLHRAFRADEAIPADAVPWWNVGGINGSSDLPYANWNPAAHPDANVTANFGQEPFVFPADADRLVDAAAIFGDDDGAFILALKK